MSCAHGIASCSQCYYDTRQYAPIGKTLNTDLSSIPDATSPQRRRAVRYLAGHATHAADLVRLCDVLGLEPKEGKATT